MKRLTEVAARPELLVDPTAVPLGDATPDLVGRNAPFGRERVVAALPLNKAGGPLQIAAAMALADPGQCCLADPDDVLIGTAAVWVHRLLTAVRTEATRRL